MALLIADRVQEISVSTGTGPFTVIGAEFGFRRFGNVLAIGDTTYYAIENGAEWEVGLATYSAADTLTRDVVIASSNGNTLVNFSSGLKLVYITAPAAMLPTVPVRTVNGVEPDQSGNIIVSGGSRIESHIKESTQSNTSTIPATLAGNLVFIPPGKTVVIQGRLIFQAAATATGAFYGFLAQQALEADGNLIGSWDAYVNVSSAASSGGLSDGDSISIAPGQSLQAGVLGTGSAAGNNSAMINMTLKNLSTIVGANVQLQFRSEVAGSAVIAQPGTSMVAFIE